MLVGAEDGQGPEVRILAENRRHLHDRRATISALVGPCLIKCVWNQTLHYVYSTHNVPMISGNGNITIARLRYLQR